MFRGSFRGGGAQLLFQGIPQNFKGFKEVSRVFQEIILSFKGVKLIQIINRCSKTFSRGFQNRFKEIFSVFHICFKDV